MFCVVAGCESCCSPYVPHLRLAKLTRNKERAQDRESIKKYKDKLKTDQRRIDEKLRWRQAYDMWFLLQDGVSR